MPWLPYQYHLVIGGTLIFSIPLYVRMLVRTYDMAFAGDKSTKEEKKTFIIWAIIETLILITLVACYFLYLMIKG